MRPGATTELTQRRLNRATLARQLLLQREPLGVVEAVHRIVAIQAQEPASPYVALWNRIEGFDPAELDRALATGDILKATLMRITLHAVDATDYPAFHSAMQDTLRGARLNDRRFRASGLQPADADALVPALLEHAKAPRANADLPAWAAEQAGIEDGAPLWFALRTYAPLVHHATGGPWSYGPRPTYRAAPSGPPAADWDVQLEWLVQRYLEGFGPATVQDVAQFALVYVPRVRRAVAAIRDRLVAYRGTDGRELVDVEGGQLPEEDVPAPPRLLPMWDSLLLAYRDRSRIIPPAHRAMVIRSNGDVLPTLLVDGLVAGVWRPVDGGIEATAFERLPDEAWEGLEAEARSLVGFLAGRDARVYSRYRRWWDRIEGVEVRVIGS